MQKYKIAPESKANKSYLNGWSSLKTIIQINNIAATVFECHLHSLRNLFIPFSC